MKLLLVFAATVTMLGAQTQTPYTATSGEITLTVAAWSADVVPTAVSSWRPVTVTGTWVTVCTSSPATPTPKAIITYKQGADVAQRIEAIPLREGGNGVRCGNTIVLIEKKGIISVSVVTASADFTDIN